MSGINKTPDESSFVGGRGDASGVELSNVLDSLENQNTGSTPEGKETILSLVSEIQELANLTSLQNLSGTLPTATTEEEQKDSTEAEDILQVFPEENNTPTENTPEVTPERTPNSTVSYFTNKLKKIGVTGTALATLAAACTPNPSTLNPYQPYPNSPYSAPVTPGAPFSPSSSAQNFNNAPETGRIVAENQYIRVREVKSLGNQYSGLMRQADGRFTSFNPYTGTVTVDTNGIVADYPLSKEIKAKKSYDNRPMIPENILTKENTAYITFQSSGILAKVDLNTKEWTILRNITTGDFAEPEILPNGQIVTANIQDGTITEMVGMTATKAKQMYIHDLEVLPDGSIATLHGLHGGAKGPGPASVIIGNQEIPINGTYPRTLVGSKNYLVAECTGSTNRKFPAVITIISLSNLKAYQITPPAGTFTNGLSIDTASDTIGFTFSNVDTAKSPGTTVILPLQQLTTLIEKEKLSTVEWNKLLPTGIPLIIAEDTTRITSGIHHLGIDSLDQPTKILQVEQK